MFKGRTAEARVKYILNKAKESGVKLACLRDLVNDQVKACSEEEH